MESLGTSYAEAKSIEGDTVFRHLLAIVIATILGGTRISRSARRNKLRSKSILLEIKHHRWVISQKI